jgi:Ni/Fe-hydrogenase subunit HybB-like protein
MQSLVRLVLGSDTYVGVLTAWISCVAAASSMLFGHIATTAHRKGYVLIFGALCFMCVAGRFIVYPNVSSSQQWNWLSLVFSAILAIVGYQCSSAIRREEIVRGTYENVPVTQLE